MLWYQAIILGIVQGLTEFLPISSSGHLVVLPAIFSWPAQPLLFDVALHVGTALALLAYFWKDLTRILRAFFADRASADGKMGTYILIGSVPAAVLGYFFENVIEGLFRTSSSVAILLFIGSALMVLAEIRVPKRKDAELNPVKALLIGLFQSLALFPGLSRSGATISGGMLFGLNREQAARFSFLMSVPIVLGAAAFKFATSFDDAVSVGFDSLALGFVSSFIVGWFAIDILLKFLRKRTLYPFVLYRLALVIVLIFA